MRMLREVVADIVTTSVLSEPFANIKKRVQEELGKGDVLHYPEDIDRVITEHLLARMSK